MDRATASTLKEPRHYLARCPLILAPARFLAHSSPNYGVIRSGDHMKLFLTLLRASAIVTTVGLLSFGITYAQVTTPKAVSSAPGTAADAPVTAWGDPDLQGIWVGSTLTPMQRPEEFGEKEFLSEAEVTTREEEARAGQFQERSARTGDPGTYNAIWFDRGTAWIPSRRTSLIVDPPDGRIPYTATARQHERPYGIGPFDSYVDLDTGERCLSDGLPQIWFGYNPNHQIFQTPTHVVIVHEMFNQRRIIPLDDRPHAKMLQWNGDPRGRWEGDTLVVESINFSDRPGYRWAATWRHPSSTLHTVERFTRIDDTTIEYEATITDPVRFEQPWTIHIPLTSDQSGRGVTSGQVFEYACHEGNYGLANILRGERVAELEARR